MQAEEFVDSSPIVPPPSVAASAGFDDPDAEDPFLLPDSPLAARAGFDDPDAEDPFLLPDSPLPVDLPPPVLAVPAAPVVAANREDFASDHSGLRGSDSGYPNVHTKAL